MATTKVTRSVITSDAISGSEIADDAIDSEHYTDASIDAAHIASNAVTTAKINADAVTGAKIADDAIDSEHYVDGSIDTAHIADDQITLAKMASGTDGQIITYDASGNPTAVGPGTDGQVLTSTGAGSPPAFEDAAGGGAWTLISTAVASSSASLTITGLDSTYDTYAIAISDMLPASDAVSPHLRFGDSSGLDSGGSDYGYHISALASASSTYNGSGSTGADSILLRASENVGNATGEGYGGLLYLSRPGDGTTQPMIHGTSCWWNNDSPTKAVGGVISGGRKAVITLDRIQFYFSSGNIASGRMSVYGIKHT